jgi:hypothetical protein
MSTITVRGNASDEELAAVVAVLSSTGEQPADGYRRWREQRLNALRHKPFGGPRDM